MLCVRALFLLLLLLLSHSLLLTMFTFFSLFYFIHSTWSSFQFLLLVFRFCETEMHVEILLFLSVGCFVRVSLKANQSTYTGWERNVEHN